MPTYKYKLKSGKVMWYANFYYTDWTGEKKHACKRGFATQREAKQYEKDFLDQQKVSSDIPFSALVVNYFEDMSHRLKPTTINNKEYIFKKHITPYFERLTVRDIDAKTVRKWQNTIMDLKDDSGEPYSQTYIKTLNNQLSAILNYAVKHYGLLQNPCHLAGSVGKSQAQEMSIWTVEQYEIFREVEKKTMYRTAFDILFYTGIRSGELLALTPADITDDRRLHITKNFAKLHGEDLTLLPKTDKSYRTLVLPEFLFNEIREYIGTLYRIQSNDRIFAFTKSGLRSEMKKVTERAGLEEIRVHDLRHSHVSMLIHIGVDIKEISERLGHESVKTTWDTYSHLYPDADVALAEKLNTVSPSTQSNIIFPAPAI